VAREEKFESFPWVEFDSREGKMRGFGAAAWGVFGAVFLLACGQGAGEGPKSSETAATHRLSVHVSGNGSGTVRSADSQIDCAAQCAEDVAPNATVKLVADADATSTFSGWQGACSGLGDCTVTMDADRDVTATFTTLPPPPPGHVRVSVSLTGNGAGRVTSTPPGIDCPGACAMTVTAGATVSLAQQADASSRFVGWGGACSGAASCSFAAAADGTAWANFDVNPGVPLALNVAVSGPGMVVSDPAGIRCTSLTCGATFPAGVPVTLTAVAGPDARFVGWGGACSGTGACSVTIAARTDVSASFEPNMVALASDAAAGTTIALNSNDVFYGSQQPGSPDPTQSYPVVRAVPKTGGTARIVAVSPAPVASIRANDSFVYWTTLAANAGLYRAPVAGGSTQVVFAGRHLSDLAMDDTNVYFGHFPQDGARDGVVYSVALAGGSPFALASGVVPWDGIAVDATDVYFADVDVAHISLKRVAKTGGDATTVLTISSDTGYGFPSIRVDSDNIYYRTAQGGVYEFAKKSGSTLTITDSGGTGTDLDVNASVVWWNVDWDPFKNPNPSRMPGILRAGADGSSVQYVDTEKLPGWTSPRIDDRYLFYIRSTSVVRRAK
jgi:Divergent InlB B-repeat domain